MAYLELSTGQVDANSPLDTTLFQQIRDNQIEFNSRLSGQTVYVQDNSTASSSSIIPIDNTKPQVTEGFQVLTGVITPFSSSDKVIIDTLVNIEMTIGSTGITFALFQDSGASAINANKLFVGAAGNYQGRLRHIIDPIGTTAASTFTVRVGNSVSGPVIHYNSDGAIFDTIAYSNMTITEIATT